MTTPADHVRILPVKPSDLPAIERLLGGLSDDARYRRWFSAAIDLPAAARWAIHPPGGLGLAAVVGDEIVGHGALVSNGAGHAEVAFEVAEPWRRHGIATRLLEALEHQADQLGIETIEADVLYFNADMLALFAHQRGCTHTTDGSIVHVAFPSHPSGDNVRGRQTGHDDAEALDEVRDAGRVHVEAVTR